MVKYFECTLSANIFLAGKVLGAGTAVEIRGQGEDPCFHSCIILVAFPFMHFPELAGVNCLGTILTIVQG
jgi:hypothetical protein